MMQQELPFSEAEATRADLWNDLNIALSRLDRQCDLHLAKFCHWVFNITQGCQGPLKKNYEEIASRPLNLCCSTSKARATVAKAVRLGLVAVEYSYQRDGSQNANSYTIDWDGICRIKNGMGVSTRHPGVSTRHPGVSTRHRFKEQLVSSVSLFNRTGTGKADPNPSEDFLKEDGDGGTTAIGACDQLSEKLVGASPILQKVAGRRIAPQPQKSLVHGIWAVIDTHHLENPRHVVEWFRRQLSTAAPALGNSEAELLLALSAAIYATSLKQCDVRKSRVGVFVSTIARKQWSRVTPYLPKAEHLLAEYLAEGCPPCVDLYETEAAR